MRAAPAALLTVALCALTAAARADVLLGPAVEPHGPGRVSLRWLDTDPTPRVVTLTSPGRADVTAQSTVAGRVHTAEFDQLEPGAEYHYVFDGADGRLAAPPDARQDLRFAVFGDSRTGDDVHRALVARVAEMHPDFYMLTGDAVEDGEDLALWQNFFAIERPLLSTAAFTAVRGNHEAGSLFQDLMQIESDTPGAAPTYGSLDLGPAHFLLLDTESAYGPGSTQRTFAERDLAAHPGVPLFVLMHRPAYSTGNHGGAESPELAGSLAPLFERYGVDVVFQGHDHDYERFIPINGVTYVVTGGAGAPLRGVSGGAWTAAHESCNNFLMVDASATRIHVKATRADGSPLDEFEIDPLANDGQHSGDEPRPAGGGCGCAVPARSGRVGMAGAAGAAAVAAAWVGARGRRRRKRA